MLFGSRFHQSIREGKITWTYRDWASPRVGAGRTYRFAPGEAVEVESVELVPVASIGEAEARKSGFGSVSELTEYLRKHSSRRQLTSRSRIYRVLFRYVKEVSDPLAAAREDTSSKALAEIGKRLDRMDLSSRREPWTRKVLELIERHPRTAASQLAVRVGRETRAFKADVRKLKELGLTVSFETGYELSP